MLERRTDLPSAEILCFPSFSKFLNAPFSKCPKSAVFAGTGLSLEQDRSEQPHLEATWALCLGCRVAVHAGGGRRWD